jgi:galactokinase
VFVPGRLCLLGEHSDWVRLSSLHLFISFALGEIFRRATNFSFSSLVTIIHKRRAGSAETIHR